MIILGVLRWTDIGLTFKVNLLSAICIDMCNSETLSLLRITSEALWHVFADSRTDFTNWFNTHIFISNIQDSL